MFAFLSRSTLTLYRCEIDQSESPLLTTWNPFSATAAAGGSAGGAARAATRGILSDCPLRSDGELSPFTCMRSETSTPFFAAIAERLSPRRTRYVTVSDPEAQASSVSLIHKRPLRALISIADYRRSLVGGLMAQMMNARFGEMSRQNGAPFLGASVGDDNLGQSVQALGVSARVADGKVEGGLSALAAEVADRAEVVSADVRSFVMRDDISTAGFDLVLADPPYAIEQDELEAVLAALGSAGVSERPLRVVLTRPKKSCTPVIPVHWLLARRLTYGDTLVFIFREA